MKNLNIKKIKNLAVGIIIIIVAVVVLFNGFKNANSEDSRSLQSVSVPAPPTLTTDATVTPINPNESLNDMSAILAGITTAEASGVSYDRGEWHHWNDITPCWSVREEVLYRDAVKDSTLTLLDRNKVRTEDKTKACYVAGGTWNDPYTGEVFTNPSDLDIDHMIPLNYAAQHGGQAWDSAKKESYANNMEYPHHLIAVSASANRSKSDKGPSEWKPSNVAYYCTYAQDWVMISYTWTLSMTAADKNTLNEMLSTCK